MTASPGQNLGKYHLLSKVGQGGMAVVYRGRDTTLNRDVAVKVLHHHLAEHPEARDRFHREAQAVAKLRHENILEIYDFSGSEAPLSYIVTEFIEGCTLKEFIAQHPIRFPEIGAMITVEVCRALVHAHSFGVLHRDVKPENIMIRRDGLVKLMDFGIAQMVDLERMTVTGQLLGSPAYMSPEHVRGNPLDFRTDVFAVGVMLYQLSTGKLPFTGNNPHEVLKRVADCIYTDPQRVCPQMGKELTAVVDRALQKDPAQRFQSVQLLQCALEDFLKTSGIEDSHEQLRHFFADPISYQEGFRGRLLESLTDQGQRMLRQNRAAALEFFNRVLTIDPSHPEVLRHLHTLGARTRRRRLFALGLGVFAMAGVSVFVARTLENGTQKKQSASLAAHPEWSRGDAQVEQQVTVVAFDARPSARNEIPTDASPQRADASGQERSVAVGVRHAKSTPRKSVASEEKAMRSFPLFLTPRNSEYRLDNGPWKQATKRETIIQVPEGEHVLSARNPDCCQEERHVLKSDSPLGPIRLNLRWLPASIVPTCDRPGVRATINDKTVALGRGVTIIIERLVGTEVVDVAFVSDDGVDEHRLVVRAKESKTVRCAF